MSVTLLRPSPAAALVAAVALLASCASGPPELADTMGAVCDEGTIAEPEPSRYDDDDDEPQPLEELRCRRGTLDIIGEAYDEDPEQVIQRSRDSVDSGDGADYWAAVAEGGDRWTVVRFSAAPSEQQPEFLAPLEEMGFEITG